MEENSKVIRTNGSIPLCQLLTGNDKINVRIFGDFRGKIPSEFTQLNDVVTRSTKNNAKSL